MTFSTIRFIHKNKVLAIHNPDPNETILNFVRTKLRKTGTKEGCAEGGCGACTIVLGELKKGKVIYKAINACIAFIPTLAGKQLVLIEDLISEDGSSESLVEEYYWVSAAEYADSAGVDIINRSLIPMSIRVERG